jgi:hypothetical protein
MKQIKMWNFTFKDFSYLKDMFQANENFPFVTMSHGVALVAAHVTHLQSELGNKRAKFLFSRFPGFNLLNVPHPQNFRKVRKVFGTLSLSPQ